MQRFDKTRYAAYAEKKAPRSCALKNSLFAFLSGGAICLLGEGLLRLYLYLGMKETSAAVTVTVTLIFLAALLTALGVFDCIARFAGAGTLVPVTGFANAVVSPAMDNKSEGLVLGVGAKIFTVAGPVILFGVFSGAVYGVIYATLMLLGVVS